MPKTKSQKRKGIVFVISAPSGCGKTTLCNRLLEKVPHLARSVSYTTRAPRKGERDGADYRFVSVEKFKKLTESGRFIEHAKVFGSLYGTPKESVKQALKNNKDILLSIDVKGAAEIKKLFGSQSVSIFVLPPSLEALRKRLMKRRADSKEQMNKRLKIAKKELSYLHNYDYVIVNHKLKDALSQLEAIMITEQSKRKT